MRVEEYSQKEYPHQQFEDEPQKQTSFKMNEYNRYEDSPTKTHRSEGCINKCTRWTLYLLPFIFFAVCFGVLIAVITMKVEQKTSNIDSAIRALNNFYSNIESYPIQSIEVVDSGSQCPAGYQKHSLYTWPGVKFGCICTDGEVFTSTCFAHTSCPDVDSVSSVYTYLWQNGTICVKNYTNPKYITPGNDCPNGYWKAQSYLCLNNTEALDPIIKMEVISVNASAIPADDETNEYVVFPENYNLTTKTTTNSTITNATVLHITRGITLSPIVDLEVTLSNPPCLDPYYTPLTDSQKYYPLLNANEGCANWGNSASYVLEVNNETETQFNDENKLDTVFSTITDYSEYLDEEEDYYELYGVRRISLGDSELCNTIVGSELTQISNSSSKLLNNVAAGAALALTLSSIGLVLSICYIFCRGCRCGQKYLCQHRCLPITLYVMGVVVAIILFCLAGYYYNEEMSINSDITTEDYLTELINGNCFTVSGYLEAAQTVETFLSESITTVGPLIVFLLAWAIIFMVIFLFCWILRSCVKRLPLFI